MKVILVFVTSLDGKITRWGNPRVADWSSKKDQQHYQHIWNEAKLIVMGRHTFVAGNFLPSPKRQLVVLTRQPQAFKQQEVADQLYFTASLPVQLVEQYRNSKNAMFVIGGAQAATAFLKEGLIDEVWLTIEPKIFGTGGNFVAEEKLDVELRLISCEKVNDEGTLITKYEVVKKRE